MTAIDRDDIITALRAAGIDYQIEHPRTINESFHVTRTDGRVVAFSPATTETGDDAEGVDVAYYFAGIDSDVRSTNWVPTVRDLIDDLTVFTA